MSGHRIDLPVALRALEVRRITDLGPRMRRLTLGGEQLGRFEVDGLALAELRSPAPDDHVKVFPPPLDGGDPVLPVQRADHLDWPGDHSVVSRDYTVRRLDLDAGEVDLDVVLHEGGVASGWAARARPGDVLHVAGPRSSTIAPEAEHLVLVGDETALPAIGRWIEEAPAATRVTALVLVQDAEDHQDLVRPGGGELDLRYLHRAEGADVVAELAALPPLGDAYVFAAGEHALVTGVRRLLREREHPSERSRLVGYWRQGVDEHEAHVAGHRLTDLAELLTPHAVRVAATLRLADHIAAGADRVAALAERTGAEPVTLAALVEHLADRGVLTYGGDGRIGLTPVGDALRDDHPSGVRRRLDHRSAHSHLDRAWGGLLATATGAGTGFEDQFGAPFWDHVHGDAALAASFDGYMAEWAYEWVPAVRDVHDWTRYRHLVDVGGGMGLLLAELLGVAPGATGTLVELPATVASARWWFAERGLADRAEAVEGDFFEALPAGDAMILAQVLHDWPDAEAARILGRCAEALDGRGPEARVLLVERLVEPGSGPVGNAPMRLLMRNLFGSTERPLGDLADLAAGCGLRIVATTPVVHGLHLLELAVAR